MGQNMQRTDICKKTLNPVWDSPWFKFNVRNKANHTHLIMQPHPLQVGDEELQEEPLTFK